MASKAADWLLARPAAADAATDAEVGQDKAEGIAAALAECSGLGRDDSAGDDDGHAGEGSAAA